MNVRHAIEQLLRPSTVAHAHCDIPCGIYDPKAAQTAAETVEKMMTLIADIPHDAGSADYANSMSRYVAAKEEHAENVKREVRIIWGDFMKPPDLATVPTLHDLVWEIMRTASACRTGTSVDDAKKLRSQVDEFAGMFATVKATR